MGYMETYKAWCDNEYFDEATRQELKSIASDEKEIEDRFYKDLEFGTGGLRGVIGNGTNRMNIYTVRKATQGLANFIIKENAADRGVAIAYDSRRMSPEFADEAALCLAANGIKAYIFSTLRPTPELSFALRELHCIAGIVVTASHNPPEYNGYKVYWEDGAQITAPKDSQIIAEVKAVTDYNTVKTMDIDEARACGLYNVIGYDMDDRYIAALKKMSINGEVIKSVADDIKIVYTPFHGTGNVPVRRVLKELGFKHVYVVPEQEKPDPDFTTLDYPNPEDPKAFTLALKLAKEVDADIILATDPDADRLGIYSKDTKTGEYISFTGNMSAMLIAEYLLSQRKEKGLLHSNGAFVTTIVSTDMAKAIAKEYNLKLIEVLTGFKFIGEQIKLFEQQGTYEYEFGFEESYGCLVGTHARDKDAPVAVMALCEAAAYYKSKGITLWDQMINIFEKYGYYREGQVAITMKGAEGASKIAQMMDDLRNNTPKKFGAWDVVEARDYKNDVKVNMATGEKSSTGLPSSNVLYYELNDNAWCCARPSGTEPKIKFYMGVKGTSLEDAKEKEEALKKAVMEVVGQ
jgi:phosphoglucomutase